MANMNSGDILSLVQKALDDIDERPVDVTARRAARIASLLGDEEMAVFLALELRPQGGHPPANRADTIRFITDPSKWGELEGPSWDGYQSWEKSRQFKNGPQKDLIAAHSLAEIEEFFIQVSAISLKDHQNAEFESQRLHLLTIRERTRHRIFSALCSWERQLTYANVNERIFERFRSRVDLMLSLGAPAVLDQFSAVYRRLREASQATTINASEDLAQAVTTCRRILKAVTDHLLPGIPGKSTDDGHSLNDSAYRNRAFEFVKSKIESDTHAAAVNAALGGLYDRFTALDKLASKGVHADVGLQEAESCAIGTYLVAGELLQLADSSAGQEQAT